ncbi:DDE superfamily endonuclease [Popillia japonica]|uniref:DDE superfamily endonuclease n=1 Tax=Popillia japonica TaxID=7064 RepID=A0AAW1HV78_POPJA
MAIPTTERWKYIANRFDQLWNIPNCLGAIDGKHVRIQKLPNSGSNGLFTIIETGYAGRNNDGGIFRASNFNHCLERGRLNLPTTACLPNDESRQNVPYFFVGDNAFPLKRYLMRPYPVRTLDNKKRIFNYRLSRGRKTIECTFGMMTQKFQTVYIIRYQSMNINITTYYKIWIYKKNILS